MNPETIINAVLLGIPAAAAVTFLTGLIKGGY